MNQLLPNDHEGPLKDIVVLDLTRALAGPHAAMMLGDLGARVIKVESEDGGDDTRGWGPPFVGEVGERESTYFLSANRNKESITLNLKSTEGQSLLRRLVRRSDVLIENFRPGVMDRLGFGIEELGALNSRLVVLSISGFGHDGPEGGRAGYDQIAQGEAGLMSLTGENSNSPQRVGVPIGDLLAGIYGAYGILAALHERAQTGHGQVVRTSLLAAIVGVHAFEGTRWTVARGVGHAQGNHHPSIAPYGLFRTGDGSVLMSVGSDSLWRSLCTLIDVAPDDARWVTNERRIVNRDSLISRIESAFSKWKSAELLIQLGKLSIPAGKVRSVREVYEWDQTISQGLLIEVDHKTLGPITVPGPPLRFFDLHDDETTRIGHRAPPTLGQHDAPVREWLDTEL